MCVCVCEYFYFCSMMSKNIILSYLMSYVLHESEGAGTYGCSHFPREPRSVLSTYLPEPYPWKDS